MCAYTQSEEIICDNLSRVNEWFKDNRLTRSSKKFVW